MYAHVQYFHAPVREEHVTLDGEEAFIQDACMHACMYRRPFEWSFPAWGCMRAVKLL
jgi:hypothetical protein